MKKGMSKIKGPKCPRTLSGEHAWVRNIVARTHYMSNTPIYGLPECEYCKIIDDKRIAPTELIRNNNADEFP